jgi:hypothetical protein
MIYYQMLVVVSGCTIFLAQPTRAAECYKAGETVTVSGTIHMHVLPPDDRGSSTGMRTYPTMLFDQPVCVDGGELGRVPSGKAAAVLLEGVDQKLTEGQHVSLQGQLSPKTDTNWPEELRLFVADLAPDAPGPDEKIISGASDAVVETCAKSQARTAQALHETTLKVLITHSSRYGTIWRADTASPPIDGQRFVSRTVCWRGMEVVRPLDMFDKSKSIPPLQ